MYVVLLGAPGAGKGTQAPMLARAIGGVHLSSGDMLRAALREGSSYGQKARDYMDAGRLVPDDVVLEMVMDQLSTVAAQDAFVLDGFPRNVKQATQLDQALDATGKRLDVAIHIQVPVPVLVRRLSGRWTCSNCQAIYHEVNNPPAQPGVCDRCGSPLRQRLDDREEAVQKRLQVYLEETLPLLDYYRGRGILREIDGDTGLREVTAALLRAVKGDAAASTERS
jgi:adenylate kinase